MTTFSDLVERTRRHLYTETRDQRNRLSTGIDSAVTTLTVDFDPTGIVAGAVLAIDAEEFFVWSVSSSSVEVLRGHRGSTAAAHSAGAMIYVNPKFSTFSIMGAINDDLVDLSAPGNGLYQVKTATLVFEPSTGAYDLTGVTDLIDIIEVTYDLDDSTSRWPTIPRSEWRIKRNMPTASFPSGMMLALYSRAREDRNINVVYRAPFTALAALTDNMSTTGLPTTAYDLPPLGAAVTLTVGAEVARNFLSQSESRRAGEVPAGARQGEMRALAAQRAQRISAEAARLYVQYPVMHA